MADKILWTYIILDLLFYFASSHHCERLSKPLVTFNTSKCRNRQCRRNLLLLPPLHPRHDPLSTTRGWLKLHGYMVVISGIFTLVIGLDIWFGTLRSKESLLDTWNKQSVTVQSLLQEELSCCGYFNSTSTPAFVTDSTCPNAIVAATMPGCSAAFVKFDGLFLDVIFTAAFGIVGLDVALIFGIAMLNKDRKERERYRFIDEKNGMGAF
ncbi:hypothetical protein EYC80_006742 [Monilinia laxa]|uniref:Tetraspanin n=1 Tax=Monilinia laxa TaxID=61186 RepID=A0A5N6JZ36_MONLA|nr:hypothetical protein EYC80_006742 [Monilinia laxa]